MVGCTGTSFSSWSSGWAWLYYLAVELQWADGEEDADDMFKDEARETVDTVDDDEYNTLPAKYNSQEELRLNINKNR